MHRRIGGCGRIGAGPNAVNFRFECFFGHEDYEGYTKTTKENHWQGLSCPACDQLHRLRNGSSSHTVQHEQMDVA